MRRTPEDDGGSTKQIGSGALEGILPFRILVVDDDEDTLMALRDRLLSMGFDVVIENNGHSALSRIALEARRAPIQGLLLDLQMPVLDGIAVLRELQQRYRAIPVILMSATTDRDLLKKTLELGARAYLVKPFNNGLLREQCLRVFLEDNPLSEKTSRDTP
jgi:CheY-like chemotaxis protein